MPQVPSAQQGPDTDQRPRVEFSCPTGALAVVSVVGEHDLGQSAMLGQALHLAVARRRNVLIDLSDCEFIDSTFVSLLFAAREEVASDGGDFVVVLPPDPNPLARTAEIMGLDEIFRIFASREQAEAHTQHATRLRDLRARFGDPDNYAAECSCGWTGGVHTGRHALRAARADARMHADTRISRPS